MSELIKLEFRKISSFHRGILFELLSDAYSFDSRCAEVWSNDWKSFDDFFFDNPHIADRCGFVSTIDGNPIGFASWDPRNMPDYAIIGHNCIATEFKGHGYGTQQILEAIRRISEADFKKIIVTTNDLLIPAKHMYERAGFRMIRRRENKHFSGGYIDYKYSLRD